jgi:hypothetical protein
MSAERSTAMLVAILPKKGHHRDPLCRPFPVQKQEKPYMTRLSGAILSLFLATMAVRAQGPPPQCSQATLNGTYVNSATGFRGGATVVSVSKVTYDGEGNGRSTGTTSVAGVISRSVAVPGVYTVNPDCTGSKTFGGATNFDFVVTPDGREITWMVTNAGYGSFLTGRAVRMENVGGLQVTKDCSAYTGAAGGYCTVTSSNLAAIMVGSKIFYDQAAGTPPGMLDSDIILDSGTGNRAIGHCTVDLGTNRGLCTFSGGTGQFSGFRARVDVSLVPGSAASYRWDGTYSFVPEVGK